MWPRSVTRLRNCDAASRDDVKNLVAECKRVYGRLDILVPNSGVSHGEEKNLHGDDDWKFVIDINLNSVYWLCRDAYPLLKASGRGKVITIGSEYVYNAGCSQSAHPVFPVHPRPHTAHVDPSVLLGHSLSCSLVIVRTDARRHHSLSGSLLSLR